MRGTPICCCAGIKYLSMWEEWTREAPRSYPTRIMIVFYILVMFAWVSTSHLPTLDNSLLMHTMLKTFHEAKDINIQNTFGNLKKNETRLEYFLIYRCPQQGEEYSWHPSWLLKFEREFFLSKMYYNIRFPKVLQEQWQKRCCEDVIEGSQVYVKIINKIFSILPKWIL